MTATCESMICGHACGRPATRRWTRRVGAADGRNVYEFCAGCAVPLAHEDFIIEILGGGA